MIAPGTIELRAIGLAAGAGELAQAAQLLAPDERERAARFVFARDRRRFTIARAALRRTLAEHLGVGARDVRLEYSPYGKPRLAVASDLTFNVSHSDDLAVIAVTRAREIGVDVERLRPVDDCLRLAAHVFSGREQECLAALPEDRSDAFLACWTRKEAYVKACGDGLSQPLDAFSVSLDPGAPVRVLAIGGDTAPARRWWLAELRPAAGFVGALAARGGPATLVWRDAET